jgi:hypothetical protein
MNRFLKETFLSDIGYYIGDEDNLYQMIFSK